jgi:hypothetical protein
LIVIPTVVIIAIGVFVIVRRKHRWAENSEKRL